MTTSRLLIYARGTHKEVAAQQEECFSQIAHNEIVASVAADPPDGSAGWQSAVSMLEAGEVDRILVASRDVIPVLDHVDSVTREMRPPAEPPHHNDEPPWQRRPRRLGHPFKRQG